jgi:Protein of unknown function (DUF1573)
MRCSQLKRRCRSVEYTSFDIDPAAADRLEMTRTDEAPRRAFDSRSTNRLYNSMNVNASRFALTAAASLLVLGNAQAELKWEQTSIELHPAFADKQAVGHFKYQNVGKTPVRFKSVHSSCGCTTARTQQDEVAPGDKGEITATFNIGGRTGTQVKTISVETEDQPNPVTTLTLKTVIPEMLSISPTFIFWTGQEQAKPKVISVKAGKDFPAKNLTVKSANPEFAVQVDPAGTGEWKISVQPKQTDHVMATQLTIQPDVKDSPQFVAGASVTGTPAAPKVAPAAAKAVPTASPGSH